MNRWNVCAHSVTGVRHQRDGKASQDRFRFWTERNRPVLVLGDGAGSKDKAGEGAEIAVNAAGADIVAFSFGASAELGRADVSQAKVLLDPVFAEAFHRVNVGIKRSAAACKDPAESYSVSITAAVLEQHWIGCVTEGDVALLSGRPGSWRLVNSIFKSEEPGHPGSRNATMLLPYRSANASSASYFAPRQPGDLAVMFCDGALSAFLIDTTPTATRGTYLPKTDALDRFYGKFSAAVQDERSRAAPKHRWRVGLSRLAAGLGSLLGVQPPSLTPTAVLTELVSELIAAGEQDDITIMAALD